MQILGCFFICNVILCISITNTMNPPLDVWLSKNIEEERRWCSLTEEEKQKKSEPIYEVIKKYPNLFSSNNNKNDYKDLTLELYNQMSEEEQKQVLAHVVEWLKEQKD